MKKILLILSVFCVSASYAQVSFPIQCESGAPLAGDLRTWDDATAAVITNPQQNGVNTSSQVLQIVKPVGAGDWAGCGIKLVGGFDPSVANGIVSFRLFTTAPIGTNILVKTETPGGLGLPMNPVQTTSNTAWQIITVDLSASYTNPNLTELIIMPASGSIGTGQTFFVDDIIQGTVFPTPTNVVNAELSNFTISPNPSKEGWLIENKTGVINSIVISDVLGNEMMELNPNVNAARIDASRFESGVYVAKVSMNGATSLIRLIKE